jgi:hypothetical protein
MEQRYNGPGKKSDASTNKNKKKNCKTKLESKVHSGRKEGRNITQGQTAT